MTALVVTDAPKRHRYEAHLDGELVGFSVYEVAGDVIAFTHARVYHPWRGRGFASQLARVSLDEARMAGRRVRPVCSFYRWYVDQHPAYADLLVD